MSSGADPNQSKGPKSEYALHAAVASKNIKIVQMLLDAGADVRIEDASGMTPLHTAVIQGSLDMVEVLLKADADPWAFSAENLSPIEYAERFKFPLIVDLLRKQPIKGKLI